MNKLYRWYSDCGRMGSLECLFVSTDEDIAKLRHCHNVSFYEVLGKHSDIHVDFADEDIQMVCDDPKVVEVIAPFLPVGNDPFSHAEEDLLALEEDDKEEANESRNNS